jgi:hypothetical protein
MAWWQETFVRHRPVGHAGERRRACTNRGTHAPAFRGQIPAFPASRKGAANTRAIGFLVPTIRVPMALCAACWTLPGPCAPLPEQPMAGGRADRRLRRHERLARLGRGRGFW